MTKPLIVHHYRHRPKPRTKEREHWVKRTDKFFEGELLKVGDLIVDEAVKTTNESIASVLGQHKSRN